jgi:transcriptional regulator with XRE-family HTH domain
MRPTGAQRQRHARIAKKLSLAALALRIGVSVESVRLWEAGRSIRGRNLLRLAKELDLSTDELQEGREREYGMGVADKLGLNLQLKALRAEIGALHTRFDRLEELLRKRL